MEIIVLKKSHFAGREAKVVNLFQDGSSLGETSKKKCPMGIWIWKKFGEILGPGESFANHTHSDGIWNNVRQCIFREKQRMKNWAEAHTCINKIMKESSKEDRKRESGSERGSTQQCSIVSWKLGEQNFKRRG